MGDVIKRGTGVRARVVGREDISGKTGTTNESRDTWFNGFNPDLEATVWVGYDQEQSLGEGEEGSSVAVPIWVRLMREALRGVPDVPRPMPPGLVSARVDLVEIRHARDANRRQRSTRLSSATIICPSTGCQRPPCPAPQPNQAATPTPSRCSSGMNGRAYMPRRNSPRSENLRRAVAQEAARVMAEHGIQDFRAAKRKAAERFGIGEEGALPRNIRDRSRRWLPISGCLRPTRTAPRCGPSGVRHCMRCAA